MKRYLLAISAFALPLFAFEGAAQAWPTKPLRVIVPVGAGSSTDIVHRLVLEQLSVQLGQPIVVENRVGAGGTSAAPSSRSPNQTATRFLHTARPSPLHRRFTRACPTIQRATLSP